MTNHRKKTSVDSAGSKKSLRVLCVDDDEPIALLLQRVLEMCIRDRH